VITALAAGERARAFKGISPGILPPLAIVFCTARRVFSGPGLERRRSTQHRREPGGECVKGTRPPSNRIPTGNPKPQLGELDYLLESPDDCAGS
jgi:hypothetical protein